MASDRATDREPPASAGRFRVFVVHAALGALLGLLAQRADSYAPWSSALTSHGGVWLTVLIVVGWAATSLKQAAWCAVFLMIGSLAGYYLSYAFDYGYLPRARLFLFWMVLAASAAPAAAALANVFSGSGRLVALAGALLAGGLLTEAILVRTQNPSDDRWAVVGFDAIAGAIVMATAAVRSRRPGIVAAAGAAATALGVGLLLAFNEVYALA